MRPAGRGSPVGLGTEDPLLDEGVEVLAAAGVAGLLPELEILAVGVDGQVGYVQPARVRAEGRLAHGQHPVGRDLHEVRPRPDVVDDPLDGHDRAASGRRGRPTHLRAAGG